MTERDISTQLEQMTSQLTETRLRVQQLLYALEQERANSDRSLIAADDRLEKYQRLAKNLYEAMRLMREQLEQPSNALLIAVSAMNDYEDAVR